MTTRHNALSALALAICCQIAFATAAPAQNRPEVDKAIQRLRNNEQGAYEDVLAIGEPAVDGLLQLARNDQLDPVVRYMSLNALGEIGSSSAVKPLLAMLKDQNFNIRRCAAVALGKIGDPVARAPLAAMAKQDPFSWRDPQTGKVRYLVREDAQTALGLLAGMEKQKETFLADASGLPPTPLKVRVQKLPWPFAGGFREQNIFNNYQQPTDIYIHGGLDFIQSAGTEVRAVADGFVAAIATNYPDWKTHHFFIVTPEKNGKEGWCYTHMDPDSYTFKLGDRVRQGQPLGKVVDFYVGKNKGADHLHLQYVRFSRSADNKIEVQSLADPLLFFDFEDAVAPAIDEQFHFVRAGTLDEFPAGDDGVPIVGGQVDIIAGISDRAFGEHGCNWGVPVITLEIKGEKSPPLRKLVLDQRGEIPTSCPPFALYLSSRQSERWLEGRPRFPVIHLVNITHTDGDGIIEASDRLQHWDTRKAPDGVYEVIVRAWDLKGNPGQRAVKVRVANAARP